MNLDDLIADGNTDLVALVRAAHKYWPAMPDDVAVVLVGPGNRIIVRVGCCQRDAVGMVPFMDDMERLIGYAGYSRKANKLAVRLNESFN